MPTPHYRKSTLKALAIISAVRSVHKKGLAPLGNQPHYPNSLELSGQHPFPNWGQKAFRLRVGCSGAGKIIVC